MSGAIIESCGNVFADLGLPPEKAEVLTLRAELLNELRKIILGAQRETAEVARCLSISQARASELMRGQHEKSSLGILIRLAARLGKHYELRLAA